MDKHLMNQLLGFNLEIMYKHGKDHYKTNHSGIYCTLVSGVQNPRTSEKLKLISSNASLLHEVHVH